MNPQKTGKFISCLRKENNLTQKGLAYKLGVSDKAVSKWETGRCYPDIEILGERYGIEKSTWSRL
jgi:transcriptional regulator with XRE-family HTH domain